jgi:radical SAM superfamily enzyme YgiQ (UPF0313 family)
MQPYPPLQTLLAAACLRRDGFEVALFDSTFEDPVPGFAHALEKFRPRLVAVCEDNFNFLTKMCLTEQRDVAFSMFRAAKEQGIPVLVNGSDASDHTAEYLDAGADYVIVGELEETLLDLARRLLVGDSGDPRVVPGLSCHPAPGGERRTPQRAPIDDLDWLPLPAWDLVDMNEYRGHWREAHGYFSLNVVSSRGCPYRCNWCAKPIYGDTYHYRSPGAVAEELRLLKSAYQPDHIWFADDIFALSGQWTREFADRVEELGACIPFKMQSRCDLMTRDTVAALRRAGCEEVWMGVESGSQKILNAMDKGVFLEQVQQARENLLRHGIRACYFLQFGYAGETWDDIQATIRLVRETRPDDIGVSVSYPLPGTKFYEQVAADLGAKRNWSDSDDLAVMFRASYTTSFYRKLRDALHLEVESMNGRVNGDAPQRVALLWREVGELEASCLNTNPTVLCTSC